MGPVCKDRLVVHILELGQVVTVNVPVLDLQHPGFAPFPGRPERGVAYDRVNGISVEVCRKLGIVDTIGRAGRLFEDL